MTEVLVGDDLKLMAALAAWVIYEIRFREMLGRECGLSLDEQRICMATEVS